MDTDIDLEKLKLRSKNIWRKNKKLIILMTAAAIAGLIIAGLNYVTYQDTINKFSLEEPQSITATTDASFTFNIAEPKLQSSTIMRLEFEGIESQTLLSVELNGEELQEVRGSSTTIDIPSEVLEEENEVVISRENLAITEQTLVSASVVSRTSLQQLIFVVLNFAAIALVFTPFGYLKYKQYIRKKKMEDQFPAFLRDVVEGTRAGMSLPQAIQNTETGSYGPLDEKIEKMSAQIDWGIPFDQVLENFGKETGSDIIQRSSDTIIQAYTSGGNIQQVLESVGENIRSIKQLTEERESQLYGEMITGYVVYFIFIGILIALTTFLLPNLADASESLGGSLGFFGGGSSGNLQENITLYRIWFQRLAYIQAIFSGLIIGKLAEGELKAGLKHSAILFAFGYLAMTFFL